MYQIFLIWIVFQSSDRVELDVWGPVIKITLNFKSRGTEEVELSSQATDNFQNLGNEALIIADYKLICKNFQVCYVGCNFIAKRW